MPLGASANTMTQSHASSVPPQHSPLLGSASVPVPSSGAGHRFRRNSFTQAIDTPPSPPRSQPPPRLSQQYRQDVSRSSQEKGSHASQEREREQRLSQERERQFVQERSSHLPPERGSYSSQERTMNTVGVASPSQARGMSSANTHSHSQPSHLSHLSQPPASMSHPGRGMPSGGMTTLESARRIAAGDTEGILAAQSKQNGAISKQYHSGPTNDRGYVGSAQDRGLNADVIRGRGDQGPPMRHSNRQEANLAMMSPSQRRRLPPVI